MSCQQPIPYGAWAGGDLLGLSWLLLNRKVTVGRLLPQWRAARRVRAGGTSPGGLLAVGANPCFPSGGRMPPPCVGTSLF